jgi:hypothetical protein
MEEERSHLICTLASRNERDLMESLLTYSPLCGGMLEYLERIPNSKLVNLLGRGSLVPLDIQSNFKPCQDDCSRGFLCVGHVAYLQRS